ncbi:PAS domain-containing sensor histidine kinase [Hwanghaeella grinnelliae]|uniref:histidine kinase n=1 Tax=Hwanghaeella grinnelliae TaxID=2500179 RepID=A0A3S2VRV1_9PROT|nr:ATP-binding protein [Hwanghaeella grinnelliae]RVU38265.1 PAS domain-containing sensor histidine kinase [Hwanghaeella grinnelliae]
MNVPIKAGAGILDPIELLITLPAFVCICFKGDVVAVNKHARKAFGNLPQDQIVGQPFVSFLSNDYQAFGAEILDMVSEETNGLQVKLAPELSDVSDLELFCVMADRVPEGMYVLYGNDITAKIRNSKDLQQGEARYRTILSGNTGMTCEIRDGMIVDINPAGQALLRVVDWQVYEGKGFSTLFHGEYQDLIASELESLCDETTPLPVRMLRSDGTVCDVEMTVASLDGKQRKHLMAQMHDISIQNTALRDLRSVNDELTQQLARVQEQQEMLQEANVKLARVSKLEAVGTFAFGIAHEMNSPIQTLSSNLDFLQSCVSDMGNIVERYGQIVQGETDSGAVLQELRSVQENAKKLNIDYLLDDAPKAIEESKQGVSHISLVVKAMRDFTRRNEGETTLFDLNTFIAEEVATLRRNCAAGIELGCQVEAAPIHLMGEKAELGRALRYIIDNAVWAIRDAEKENGSITISAWADSGSAKIEISDDGVGMEQETLNQAFDPFFTTREVGRGIGQGLTIAHHIVKERNGGDIEVSSSKGVGTVVSISLPLADTAESDDASVADVDVPDDSFGVDSKTILGLA